MADGSAPMRPSGLNAGLGIMEQLRREELARLAAARRVPIPDFRPGDTLVVNVRIREGDRERIQAFQGVCIGRSGRGVEESFTVRKISYGEGVERVFPVQSPVIDSIEVRRRGVVRRAKLYYLRDRRGKSARIAERHTQRAQEHENGGPGAQHGPAHSAPTGRSEPSELLERLVETGQGSPQGEPQSELQSMVAALSQLRALKGEAEGARARAAVERAVRQLPDAPLKAARRADAYAFALSIGEHLCPLLFSTDPAIARTARVGLQKLGCVIDAEAGQDAEARLALVLRHLEVAVVVRLSIVRDAKAAEIRMTAEDVLFAAAHTPGLDAAHPVRLQLLLEDVGEDLIETLADDRLGPKAVKKVKRKVTGDADDLGAKLVTILADGREVFRSRLTREAERVLVI